METAVKCEVTGSTDCASHNEGLDNFDMASGDSQDEGDVRWCRCALCTALQMRQESRGR